MSGSSNGSFPEIKRKTVMSSKSIPCRHWMLKGYCDMKDDCKFGHGDREAFAGLGVQFKTKLCRVYLQSGSCPNGPTCSFAHGDSDLRSLWPGLGGKAGGPRFPGDNMKTVMCKNWTELGTCSFGEKCTFAHSEEQIRNGKEQKILFQNPLYKTTLCKQYSEGDFCELGENCHFAHGKDELRVLRPLEKTDPSNDPSFKTVICKNWEESDGSCEYGDSCRFAHGKEELRVVRNSEGLGMSRSTVREGAVREVRPAPSPTAWRSFTSTGPDRWGTGLRRYDRSDWLYCRSPTTGRLSARPGATRASAGTGRPACTPTGTVS